MLKTHLAWLLNVLVFTTSIQKKADLVVLQILLLPSSVMLFLLLIFPLFCKDFIRSIRSTFFICLFKLSSRYFPSKEHMFSQENIVFNLNVFAVWILFYNLLGYSDLA